jgi:hypothetical protein
MESNGWQSVDGWDGKWEMGKKRFLKSCLGELLVGPAGKVQVGWRAKRQLQPVMISERVVVGVLEPRLAE